MPSPRRESGARRHAASAAAAEATRARAATSEPATLSLGPLKEVVGYHIAQAAVVTYGLFERFIGQPFDLRKTEYSMLMLLWANGPLSPKRLAKALALSAPNLTMLLDRLQGRGLLRRERSEVDRRSQNIVLTPDGQQLASEAADAARPMELQLLGHLSPAEHAMLIELLSKVAGR